MLKLHNHFRNEVHLTPFTISEFLTELAEKDVRWMAKREWLSLWQFDKRKLEIPALETNIAVAKNEQLAINHWLSDPINKDKILGNFESIGFATFTSKSGFYYWCVYYG